MKCPRCQNDNYEGARFCTACGCMMPRKSRLKKFLIALLHAFLYVALFLGVKETVRFVYELIHFLRGSGQTQYMEAYFRDMNLLSLLSGLITILVLVISFRVRHLEPQGEMHLRKVPLNRLPWYFVLGIFLQPVTNFFLGFLPPELLADFAEANVLNYTTGPLSIELLNVVILAPIVEELIFRGLALTRLYQGMGAVPAILISSAIFGFVHGHPVSFVYASILGVVLAWLMMKNNESIIASILCHMGFNAGSYLLVWILGDVTSTPLILAVYAASLAMVILCTFMTFRPIPDEE